MEDYLFDFFEPYGQFAGTVDNVSSFDDFLTDNSQMPFAATSTVDLGWTSSSVSVDATSPNNVNITGISQGSLIGLQALNNPEAPGWVPVPVTAGPRTGSQLADGACPGSGSYLVRPGNQDRSLGPEDVWHPRGLYIATSHGPGNPVRVQIDLLSGRHVDAYSAAETPVLQDAGRGYDTFVAHNRSLLDPTIPYATPFARAEEARQPEVPSYHSPGNGHATPQNSQAIVPVEHAIVQHPALNTCTKCNAVHATGDELQKHAHATGHSPYACLCGKTFRRNDALKRHTADSTVACPFCDNETHSFTRRDHLLQHLRGFHKLGKDAINSLKLRTGTNKGRSIVRTAPRRAVAAPSLENGRSSNRHELQGVSFNSALVDDLDL